MRASMDQLKQAAEIIKKEYNINQSDACRVVGSFHCDLAEIEKILAGDLSSVPAAAASVGVHNSPAAKHDNDINNNASNKKPVKGQNKPVKRSKSKSAIKHNTDDIKADSKPVTASNNITGINDYNAHSAAGAPDVIQAEIKRDDIEKIDGDTINKHDLPAGFAETVRGWLLDFQAREGWEDLCKISALQWRAACQYVGYNIKQSKILYDFDFLRVHGGAVAYDPYKAEKLLAIWDHFTCIYKHVPILADFINFCGVSQEWFFDSQGQGLSSSRVELAQKARRLCESGLESALSDSRENPTGRIFTAKARYGWQESTTITHVSAAAVPSVSALPVFDNSAGLLTDNTQ